MNPFIFSPSLEIIKFIKHNKTKKIPRKVAIDDHGVFV
jgi:hypothetical protein